MRAALVAIYIAHVIDDNFYHIKRVKYIYVLTLRCLGEYNDHYSITAHCLSGGAWPVLVGVAHGL